MEKRIIKQMDDRKKVEKVNEGTENLLGNSINKQTNKQTTKWRKTRKFQVLMANELERGKHWHHKWW